MNTTLESTTEGTPRGLLTDHAVSGLPAWERRTPRTSLLDRAAMWLGVKLLRWSTRPLPQHESAPVHERRREMLRYEREYERNRTRALHGAWLDMRSR